MHPRICTVLATLSMPPTQATLRMETPFPGCHPHCRPVAPATTPDGLELAFQATEKVGEDFRFAVTRAGEEAKGHAALLDTTGFRCAGPQPERCQELPNYELVHTAC